MAKYSISKITDKKYDVGFKDKDNKEKNRLHLYEIDLLTLRYNSDLNNVVKMHNLIPKDDYDSYYIMYKTKYKKIVDSKKEDGYIKLIEPMFKDIDPTNSMLNLVFLINKYANKNKNSQKEDTITFNNLNITIKEDKERFICAFNNIMSTINSVISYPDKLSKVRKYLNNDLFYSYYKNSDNSIEKKNIDYLYRYADAWERKRSRMNNTLKDSAFEQEQDDKIIIELEALIKPLFNNYKILRDTFIVCSYFKLNKLNKIRDLKAKQKELDILFQLDGRKEKTINIYKKKVIKQEKINISNIDMKEAYNYCLLHGLSETYDYYERQLNEDQIKELMKADKIFKRKQEFNYLKPSDPSYDTMRSIAYYGDEDELKTLYDNADFERLDEIETKEINNLMHKKH